MNSRDLTRTTFRTSRLLDFCSTKELVAQTGHDVEDWPVVIVKELLDNALDACEDEEAGVAPKIMVIVEKHGISVTDNGPGLPDSTIAGVLDYSVRVSSREAYVAPDRGAQGNALKTILAMPFAVHGECGRVEILTGGKRHEITFEVDTLNQRPEVGYRVSDSENVKTGTRIRVRWPRKARY